MKYILILLIGLLAFSCKTDKNKPEDYYAQEETDSLVTNLITYVFAKAPGATDSTKWEPKFRSFYTNNLPSFHLENYTIAPNGWHYYFLIRPVGGSDKRRGVVGKFKLAKNSLVPIQFEETINTPHLDEELVRERGKFLFQELVKNDNLDKYMTMKHYIEWPDNSLIYNKKTNSWVPPTSKILSN